MKHPASASPEGQAVRRMSTHHMGKVRTRLVTTRLRLMGVDCGTGSMCELLGWAGTWTALLRGVLISLWVSDSDSSVAVTDQWQ